MTGGADDILLAALGERALALVRAAARGNGLKPENLTLQSFDGSLLPLESHILFSVESSSVERHINGKDAGEVVASEQALRAAIEGATDKAKKDPEIRKAAADMVRSRKDLGFAQSDLVLKVDRLRKNLVTHMACGTCETRGNTPCNTCRGSGFEACPKCHGTKDMMCPACRGAQAVNTPSGRVQCPRCTGRGRTGCDLCRQGGKVQCRACKGRGNNLCTACGATGWKSHGATVEIVAKGRCEYAAEHLSAEAARLVEALGAETVTDGHAIPVSATAGEIEEGTRAGTFAVPVNLRLPWGRIVIAKNGEESIEGWLFGMKPALVGFPPFIEAGAGPGLAALTKAGSAAGDGAAQLRLALKYRLSADALSAAMRFSRKRAIDAMHKKYPFGVRSETIERLITDAARAVSRATKKMRIAGLMAGVGLAGVLYVVYFFGGLRASVLPAGASAAVQAVLDISIGAAGVYLSAQFIGLAAQYALRSILVRGSGKADPQKKPVKSPKVRPGSLAYVAYGAAAVFYAVLLAVAVTGGMAMPLWLPF